MVNTYYSALAADSLLWLELTLAGPVIAHCIIVRPDNNQLRCSHRTTIQGKRRNGNEQYASIPKELRTVQFFFFYVRKYTQPSPMSKKQDDDC